MNKSKKWAKHGDPDTPISIVASRALDYRLRTVRRLAPLAAKKASQDVEHVHRLRVAIRRASAALKLYSPLLSYKRTRRVKRQLRDLRRAAGPARDLDVLADNLRRTEKRIAADLSNAKAEKGLAKLRDMIAVKRRKAQKRLKRACREAEKTCIGKDGKKLVESVKWKSKGKEANYQQYARGMFRQILESFFAAGRADLNDIEALHQLRIEGKSVRYAMELLSPAFDGSFRKDLYPVFASVQERLGAINDHASAITFYRDLLKSTDLKACRSSIESMIELENTEIESKRFDFMQWCTAERMEEMRQQFEAIIGTEQAQKQETIQTKRDSRRSDNSLSSTG